MKKEDKEKANGILPIATVINSFFDLKKKEQRELAIFYEFAVTKTILTDEGYYRYGYINFAGFNYLQNKKIKLNSKNYKEIYKACRKQSAHI